MEKRKVQLTGNATLVGSKNFPAEVTDKMLEAPEGHHAEVQVSVPATMLRGKLRQSSAGNLTCCFALKADNFEVVIVPDKSKETNAEPDLEALAASLM
jgi:hypothetical protein